MKEFRGDLHIHTCLSPCAEREMSPPAVVEEARRRGLHVIAICDHNSGENVEAVSRAAANAGLAVIGGMEITTREEAHVLGLFKDGGAVRRVQEVVYRDLPGENDARVFGEQWVMDARGEVVRHNRRLLIGATGLSLAEVVGIIHELEGFAIAAHVDRPRFSVMSQLGFIPPGLDLDGVEVCADRAPAMPRGLAVLRSSDAHRLAEIGSRHTRFLMKEPTFWEIGKALRRRAGRRILPEGEEKP